MTVSDQLFIKHFSFSQVTELRLNPTRKEVVKGLQNRSKIFASSVNVYQKKQLIIAFVFSVLQQIVVFQIKC